jgi:FAD/FMN-containing dehydrogenase
MARGIGAIYFSILPAARDEDVRHRVEDAANKIVAAAQRLDGHATIPWCPSEWKESLPVWGPVRADFPQMKKLKSLFDPQGIFAPGRFVGGL